VNPAILPAGLRRDVRLQPFKRNVKLNRPAGKRKTAFHQRGNSRPVNPEVRGQLAFGDQAACHAVNLQHT
jgi:hypothetical protein